MGSGPALISVHAVEVAVYQIAAGLPQDNGQAANPLPAESPVDHVVRLGLAPARPAHSGLVFVVDGKAIPAVEVAVSLGVIC
jgi:hypothetical protein